MSPARESGYDDPRDQSQRTSEGAGGREVEPMSTCYACGKSVAEADAYARITLSGEVYLLCCPMCMSSVEAGRVQRMLIPSSFSEERTDIFVEYLPALQVGGDYASIRYSPRNKLYLVIGDVSGHGITSSLLMSRLSAETERFIADDEDLASMAKALNGWMHSLVGDEPLYVTLFAAIINFDTRTLSYINCGHPAQLFWSNTNRQRIALDSGNMPVGLFGDEKFGDVRERRFDVGSGDKLMLFTDGMQELWSEGDGGEEDWIRVFDRFIDNPTPETVRGTLQQVTSKRGPSPADDVLFVLVSLKAM